MSFNFISLLIALLLFVAGKYITGKIDKCSTEDRFLAESCFVGIFIIITAYILFAISVYYSSSYQSVIFREIARNNNAIGNLSLIVTSGIALIILGLFIIHSIRQTGTPLGNYKKLFLPDSKAGKKALSLSVILVMLIGAESTYRKFYVREMVAYYNQLVSIANIPTFDSQNIFRRYFDAKMAQIDSMGEFYAIEKALKNIIEQTGQENPKRLREKFSIGEWKPYDSYLDAAFPRDVEMDVSFYEKIQDEIKTLKTTPGDGTETGH